MYFQGQSTALWAESVGAELTPVDPWKFQRILVGGKTKNDMLEKVNFVLILIIRDNINVKSKW